jgi:hypothetical protein
VSLPTRLVAAAALAVLGAPLFGAAQSRRPAQVRTDEVLVTSVSRDPTVGSGFILFFVEFAGEMPNGERTYLIPFLLIGQAKPHVGQRCTVAWHWWSGGGSNGFAGDDKSIWEGRWVDGFRCRDGGEAVPQ